MNSLIPFFVTTGMAIRSPRAEEPCRNEAGQVICSAEGFKRLTDIIIQTKAKADKCDLRLADATKDAERLFAEVDACHNLARTIPPLPPPPSAMRPLTGYALGILGTISLAGMAVMDVPSGVRFPVMLVGFGLLGTGAVLVLPQ